MRNGWHVLLCVTFLIEYCGAAEHKAFRHYDATEKARESPADNLLLGEVLLRLCVCVRARARARVVSE